MILVTCATGKTGRAVVVALAARSAPVRAVEVGMRAWLKRTSIAGTSFQRRRFAAMYRHYNAHGVPGNPKTLAMLLGRPPTDFRTCVERMFGAGTQPG